MATLSPPWTLGQLATLLEGELFGPAGHIVKHPATADANDPDGIAFTESEKFLAIAEASGVGALLVSADQNPAKPHIKVAHPRRAFGMLLHLAYREMPIETGIHATAVVHPTASIDPSASIGAFVVIEEGTTIGASVRIFASAYIGAFCKIGDSSTIFPNATLYRDTELGKRCIIHAGAVLGADGFGFYWDGKKQQRVPQAGYVALGDDCEIGALTAVDRATAGATRLGDGVKIDNQVQVGHNVQIGDHTVIAAQTGISGSAKIGKRVTMAGKVDIVDHVSVCDDVIMAGRTGVPHDITVPGAYFGAPALPHREGLRVFLAQGKVPEMMNRLRALEKKVQELEGKS